MDSFGQAAMVHGVSELWGFPSLGSSQRRLPWACRQNDLALHPVTGFYRWVSIKAYVENWMHLLAKNHLQLWPPHTVPSRECGERHHQEVMAPDWAPAAQGCQLNHLSCNPLDPEGKRKHGWPKTTWPRTVETEMKKMNHSWGTIKRLASDRQGWRSFVAALFTIWRDG